jgi:fatty acid synthase, animal type
LGLEPKISNLYPPVEFPVSNGTPMLSHLIEWDHSEDWHVIKSTVKKIETRDRILRMSVADDGNKYLTGHNVDGDTTATKTLIEIYSFGCVF